MKRVNAIVGMMALGAIVAGAVNPYLPLWEHIPDGEPYVFEDPDQPGQYRVYIYGSHDSLETEYCGKEQVVWSAPVDDLSDWRYDGVIFESKVDANGEGLHDDDSGDVLYAPDVALVTGRDGTKTYYLYPNNQAEGRNGMIAKSDRPDGPFVVCNWDEENPQAADGVLGFDPAVFVDDNGRVYGYWGFGESWGAELDPATMATIKPGTKAKHNLVSGVDQPGVGRFYEASSMRKIKDKYVLIYSRMTADDEFGLPRSNYTLAYAYANHPLGPFTYGGTIIDGRGRTTLPDGTTVPTAHPNGNTHGSICQIGDQWWVFYHRQSGTDEYSRQAMVAPIDVQVTTGLKGKVKISEAEYTSEGFDIEGLALDNSYPAAIACYYVGPSAAWEEWPNYKFSGSYVQPTRYYGDPDEAPSDIELMSNPVINNTAGSTVGYKYFNFATAPADEMTLMMAIKPLGQEATVTVLAGTPIIEQGGVKLGEVKIAASDPQTPIIKYAQMSGFSSLEGKQPIFFLFDSPVKGESLCDFFSFGFQE
ncbi:MAG: family 43 glycosylhydrolase [Bacteroidales bacterium]|nr:family 43 glycosylhydrolase [Bacteroidales bacterium]